MQRAAQRQCLVARRLEEIQTRPEVATTIEDQLAEYQAITPAELQQAARRFLLPDRAWKLVIVPETAAAPAPAPH